MNTTQQVYTVKVTLCNNKQIDWFVSGSSITEALNIMEEKRAAGHFDVFDKFEIVGA
jgi:hypothetical protein